MATAMERVVWQLLALAAVAALAAAAGAEAPSGRAHLLVHQTVVSPALVEGRNATFAVAMLNAGAREALDVQLEWPGWPAEKFAAVEGRPEARVQRLAAGAKFEHRFTVRALESFRLAEEATAATIKYRDGETHRSGRTVGLSLPKIMSAKRYHRETAAFTVEWTRFALVSAICWVVPLVMWATSRQAFQARFSFLSPSS